MFPIQLGSPADFECVREFLSRSQFTEREITARLGVPILTQATIDEAAQPESNADSLDLLIRLFVRNLSAAHSEAARLFPKQEFEVLTRLGLLVALNEPAGTWYSPVCLCPVNDVFTVSDRWKAPDGKPIDGFDDIVYPAVMPNTRFMFLGLLPQSKCDSFLDVCSGSGVAGLLAASTYAREAYAFDVAPRSTHFAEFAKRLNGFTNFTASTGDLYEPAGDVTFDRIVAHPPYIPVLEPKSIFYSGGDDGEQVTKRVFIELPRYLRPGGTLHCLAMASDRAGQPLEARIREWLGPQHEEFDVAITVHRVIEPEILAFKSLARGPHEPGQARRWKDLFEEWRLTSLAYLTILVQRKAIGRPPFTVRRQTGSKTTHRDHEWLLNWESTVAAGAEPVLAMHLSASPACELRVLNRINAGDWEAVAYSLATDNPFRMEMQTDPWIPYLLTRCDGSKTGLDLFAEMKHDNAIHPSTSESDFAEVLKTLVSGGFLLATRT